MAPRLAAAQPPPAAAPTEPPASGKAAPAPTDKTAPDKVEPAPAAPSPSAGDAGKAKKPTGNPKTAPAMLEATGSAEPAPGRPRVAIIEFALEGGGTTPALAMQLQDGFSIGLLRQGVDIIDVVDSSKRLDQAPELKGCESSPCLKRLGDLLGVRFVLRVRVSVLGNSYQMSARLFSTEGAAPAALPVATQSRVCNVCTVEEAREQMVRLADGIEARIEATPAPPPPPAPPEPESRLLPYGIFALGLVAVAAGAVILATSDERGKRMPALGGALMGAGLSLSVTGLYHALDDGQPSPARPKTAWILSGTWRF